MQNSGDHETLSCACHVGLHVGLSSIQTSLIPSAFNLYCKVMWVGLCVFNQGEILDFSGNGLSSPCVKVPL
jgi:hypothetical protein